MVSLNGKENGEIIKLTFKGSLRIDFDTISEQLAHPAVDLHLKETSEFLHGSEMNKNLTLPFRGGAKLLQRHFFRQVRA